MDKVHRWREYPFHVWLSHEEMRKLNYILMDFKGNRAERFRALIGQLSFNKRERSWRS